MKWIKEHWVSLATIAFIICAAIIIEASCSRLRKELNKVIPQSDTVYINNQDVIMDAFIYGWKAGRSLVIRAVNSTGGVVNPDTVHKQIEAAFPRDTALFHLKLKAE
jgi:hypothetical protein